jgi:hypothetical protein
MNEKANGERGLTAPNSETSQGMTDMPTPLRESRLPGRFILDTRGSPLAMAQADLSEPVERERLGSVTVAAQLGADLGRELRARFPAGIDDPA